jgi:hypothetical protein
VEPQLPRPSVYLISKPLTRDSALLSRRRGQWLASQSCPLQVPAQMPNQLCLADAYTHWAYACIAADIGFEVLPGHSHSAQLSSSHHFPSCITLRPVSSFVFKSDLVHTSDSADRSDFIDKSKSRNLLNLRAITTSTPRGRGSAANNSDIVDRLDLWAGSAAAPGGRDDMAVKSELVNNIDLVDKRRLSRPPRSWGRHRRRCWGEGHRHQLRQGSPRACRACHQHRPRCTSWR